MRAMVAYGGRCPAFVPLFLDLERAGIPEPKGVGAAKPIYVAAVWGLLLDRAVEKGGVMVAEASIRSLGAELFKTNRDAIARALHHLVNVGRVVELGKGLWEVIPVYPETAKNAESDPNPRLESGPETCHMTDEQVARKRATDGPETCQSQNSEWPGNRPEVARNRASEWPGNVPPYTLSRYSDYSEKQQQRECERETGEGPRADEQAPAAAAVLNSPEDGASRPLSSTAELDSRDTPAEQVVAVNIPEFTDTEPDAGPEKRFRLPLRLPDDRRRAKFYDLAARARLATRRALNKTPDDPSGWAATIRKGYSDNPSEALVHLDAWIRLRTKPAEPPAPPKPVRSLPPVMPEESDPPSDFLPWLKLRLPEFSKLLTDAMASDHDLTRWLPESTWEPIKHARNGLAARGLRSRVLGQVTEALRVAAQGNAKVSALLKNYEWGETHAPA